MPDMPQFQEEQPVLNPVRVNSKAEGFESFSHTLEKLAGESGQAAIKLETDQSQAMYVHSVANIEQLKNTSQMRLLQHPDQADRIAEDMQAGIDQIKQMAFVNKGDRERLTSYADGASDDIALKAVETNAKQTRLMAAFTHYVNWPDQLKAYRDALLSGNEKQAEDLQKGMLSTIKGLVQIGALTPEQAGTNIKSMHGMVEMSDDGLSMYQRERVTARDYHTFNSHPLNGEQSSSNLPINESTRWLVDHYNTDKSMQGVLSSISKGMLPNPESYYGLPHAQRLHANEAMEGVRIANGMINAAEPFPVIEKQLQDLSTHGRILNYREQFARNRLLEYVSDLKHGNYLDAIGKSPAGAAITENFINRNAAILSSPIDDAQKMQQIAINKNMMVNAAVSYGEAKHIPTEYIKPIPNSDLTVAENAFKLNEDPAPLLTVLSTYTKPNQAYFANSLGRPDQRLIVQTLSYLGNGVKPQDRLDFIAANQSGRSYEGLKYEESGLNDQKIRTRIAANLRDQLGQLTDQYGFEDGQTFQNSMIHTTMNYAKYLGAKNNDLTMKSWDKWVDQATAIYKNGFEKTSGLNYSVNPKQLPTPLTSTELDILANYVTTEGYKRLHQGINDAVFDSMQSRNPLRMRFSSTNEIQAVDQNGRVYFSQPFTNNLIAHAKSESARLEKEKNNLSKESYEKTAKLQLGVR